MYYRRFIILLLIINLSCNQTKNKDMLKQKINPCGIRNEDLNESYVKNNIKRISLNEDCIFYILDNLAKDYDKNSLKAISIFDIICSNISLEPLIDYSKEFFEKTPILILDYLSKNPKSGIKKNIINGYNIYTEYGEKTKESKTFFNKLRNEKLSESQKNILESIYNNLIFNYIGVVSDEDGYVNIRENKNSSSEIIQKIDSGNKVIVKDTLGVWYEIETRDGIKGYIHKSRIKLQ